MRRSGAVRGEGTDASVHDSEPTEELVDQGQKNDLGPTELVGDCAYGTGPNRRRCRDRGVEVRAKDPVHSYGPR